MLRRLLVAVLGLSLFGLASAANAQVEVPLGEEVALKIIKDIDSIDVRSKPGRYSGIRVYALEGSAVDISKIDIVYSDGKTFTEDRGKLIQLNPTSPRTKVIGPQAGEQFIDKIVLYYKTAPGEDRRARVRVTGVTSPAGARAVRIASAPGMPPPPLPPAGSPPAAKAPASGPISAAPTTPAPVSAAPGTVVSGGSAVLFGVGNVGFARERDVISVGREVGKFDKVQLRVLDNDVYIRELIVTYAGGDTEVIVRDAEARANTRTRWFQLKGDRFVDKIEIVYRSLRAGVRGEARVEVYGEYAEGWSAADGEGRKFNRGRVYIGGASPLLFSLKKGLGYEKETISVGRNRGGFKQLFMVVRDRDITLKELKVNYTDGTSQIIPFGSGLTGETIKVGSEFGPIALQGKAIRDFEVRYRSQFFSAGGKGVTTRPYAFVEFWAVH